MNKQLLVRVYLTIIPWLAGTRNNQIAATFSDGEAVGSVFLPSDTQEASGLAASWRNDGVLWTHNDSGDRANIYAISTNGDYLGAYKILKHEDHRDFEDIAIGPGPDVGDSYLYIGDIGNNGCDRRNEIRIFRVKEPIAPSDRATRDLSGVDSITMRYPTNDCIDAETLMVDPILGEIYILRKNRFDGTVIYATPRGTTNRRGSFEIELEERGRIDGIQILTGGDISRDGSEILVKDYYDVFLFRRRGSKPVSESLINREGFDIQNYDTERQGEAIAFAADLSGFYTLSEAGSRGGAVPLLFYRREGSIPQPPRPTQPTPPTPRPTPDPNSVHYICNGGDCFSKLQRCQGDCDEDDECAEGLVCWHRTSNDFVPGCLGGEDYDENDDFCIPKEYMPTAAPTYPTDQPSFNPTRSPSIEPSRAPVDPYSLQIVCNNNCNFPLQMCEGECDEDEDCGVGLVCWQRGSNKIVPGCIGGLEYDENHDFCILKSNLPTSAPTTANPTSAPTIQPTPNPTLLPSNNPTNHPTVQPSVHPTEIPSTEPSRAPIDPYSLRIVCNNNCDVQLQMCEGECDTDDQCGEGLVCWQRGSNEIVPGCIGGLEYDENHDFCILESNLPTSAPTTANPTSAPTIQPSRNPTLLPSNHPTNHPTVQPSVHPTDVPSTEPSRAPIDPYAVQIVCNENCEVALEACRGDCDSDDHCGEGLVCWQRGSNEEVPGCHGGEDFDESLDFCVLGSIVPPKVEFICNGDDCPALQRCQADCDSDDQCESGLICWSRGPSEAVPGCLYGETHDHAYDYCIRKCDDPDSFTICPPATPPPVLSILTGNEITGTDLSSFNGTDGSIDYVLLNLNSTDREESLYFLENDATTINRKSGGGRGLRSKATQIEDLLQCDDDELC